MSKTKKKGTLSPKERKLSTLRSLLSQHWKHIENTPANSPDLQRAILSLTDFIQGDGQRFSFNQLIQNLEILKKHQILSKSTVEQFLELLSLPTLPEEEAFFEATELYEKGHKKMQQDIRLHLDSPEMFRKVLDECIYDFNQASAILEPYKGGEASELYIRLGTYLARCCLLKYECISFPDPENLRGKLNMIDPTGDQML